MRYVSNRSPEHYVTIPDDSELRPGTINYIIREVANSLNISKSELVQLLFGD